MQDTWTEATQSTQFGEVTDVHEIHVLKAIFERVNRPIKKWMESEGIYNEPSIQHFIDEEMEAFKNSSHEEEAVSSTTSKPLSNPFGGLFNIFKPKEKYVELEITDSYATNENNDENIQDNEIPENEYNSEYNSEHEQEVVENIEPSNVIKEEKRVATNRDRILRVGDSYNYQESELIARGMPDEIIDEFMQIAEEYGPLPDRILFNKKKVYFENLLYENLTIEEYKVVVEDLKESIKAAVARSPFRSSTPATSSTPHSLFKKTTEEVTTTEPEQLEEPVSEQQSIFNNSVPEYAPVTEEPAIEQQSIFNNSVPEYAPVTEEPASEQQSTIFNNSVPEYTPVTEEPASEQQSIFDNSVPEYTPVSEEPASEQQSIFDNSVPAYTPVSEEQVSNESPFDNSVPAYTPVSEEQISNESPFDNSVPAYTPVSEETVQNEVQEDYQANTPIRPADDFSFTSSISKEPETVNEEVKEVKNEPEVTVENTTSQAEQTEQVVEEVIEEVVEEETSTLEKTAEIEPKETSKVKYIKDASPSDIYSKYKTHIDISALLNDSKSLYLTKDIKNLQEGFHWSEMLNFVPINSVSPTPKIGKVDIDIIKAGVLEKKS